MTETIPDPAFREFMESRFTPERVAASAAFLSHEQCSVTGELFAVGGGRIARVFLGVTEGYMTNEPTPEDTAGHIDEIMDTERFTVPTDRVTEFGSYLGRLGFDAARLSMAALVEDQRRDREQGT
jgi:hypothetical protein